MRGDLSCIYLVLYSGMDHESTSLPFRLSDEELLSALKRLAGSEREATASLVSHLAELDARRLFLGAGFPSLFAYCTTVLRLSEDATCNRIAAARLVRRLPHLLGLIQDGRLNLTTLRLIGPLLDRADREELLEAASGKSRREVELLVAQRAPRPEVPTSIRKLPEPGRAVQAPPPVASPPVSTTTLAQPPSRRPVVAALTEAQYKVTFTARKDTCEKLKRAQDLLRHQIPDGNPAEIFDRALSLLLDDLARKKVAAVGRPRPSEGSNPGSRHVPAEVRRAVWRRDEGRCAFVAKDGRRCTAQTLLEFHHLTPYAVGGEASVGNIALRCRPHNGYEADLFLGMRERFRSEPGIRSGTDTFLGTVRPRS